MDAETHGEIGQNGNLRKTLASQHLTRRFQHTGFTEGQ